MVPIPGTTKLSLLDKNIAAAAVEFTPGDLRHIDAAAAQISRGRAYAELEAPTPDRSVCGKDVYEHLIRRKGRANDRRGL